ncbi:hypothetical protein [Ruegeria sp. HKCCA6837]|uniref:hypothetical protein n=1 Tax=Ruegeria sp. HKCCA6837 TaxID=2682989 RepID=UPI001489D189|nr:hypothetical protein [Ruegeria sp. HKCCA6837]
MKREPKEQSRNSAPLKDYHANRSKRARDGIIDMMKQIDTEISARGYYCDPKDPDRPLGLSMAEVLRRSGLGVNYLRNERHLDLREHVKAWLKNHKRSDTAAKRKSKKARRDAISFLQEAIRVMSSEAQSWLIEKEKLQTKIDNLEADIRNIRDSGNVVGIGSRKRK